MACVSSIYIQLDILFKKFRLSTSLKGTTAVSHLGFEPAVSHIVFCCCSCHSEHTFQSLVCDGVCFQCVHVGQAEHTAWCVLAYIYPNGDIQNQACSSYWWEKKQTLKRNERGFGYLRAVNCHGLLKRGMSLGFHTRCSGSSCSWLTGSCREKLACF